MLKLSLIDPSRSVSHYHFSQQNIDFLRKLESSYGINWSIANKQASRFVYMQLNQIFMDICQLEFDNLFINDVELNTFRKKYYAKLFK